MKSKELKQTEEKLYAYFKNIKLKNLLSDKLRQLNAQRREIELLTPMLNAENPELVKLLENVNTEILTQSIKLLDYEKGLSQVEFAFETLDDISKQIIVSRYRDKKILKTIAEDLFLSTARIYQLIIAILNDITKKIAWNEF